jgi:hypothetical protein
MESEKPPMNEAARITLPRRRFLLQTGAVIGALTTLDASIAGHGTEVTTAQRSGRTPEANRRFFRFAVIADTHIIDDFYKGPEGNALDTETIFKTAARLESARALINGLSPAVERVFLVGDYFHDYPSLDYDFYFKNRTRIDNAKTLTDGFRAPVHVGFGNHDYAVPKVSREMSHELFQAKLGLKPYYSVEHRGHKFIHLNNFIGNTWNPASAEYNRDAGSLGEEQLNWFEAQLRERKPSFVFIHYPLINVKDVEVRDYGILPLLKRYKENIQFVVAGHKHKWYDFAHTFGAQHYVMGSTRYDEDAYMIVDVDTRQGTHRIINLDLVDWATHYSRPYRQKNS